MDLYNSSNKYNNYNSILQDKLDIFNMIYKTRSNNARKCSKKQNTELFYNNDDYYYNDLYNNSYNNLEYNTPIPKIIFFIKK